MEMAIGLTFPGTLQDEAILCNICKNFDVELKIIEASFSLSAGWAILKIKGSEEEIKKSFEFLSLKGVRLERLGTEK